MLSRISKSFRFFRFCTQPKEQIKQEKEIIELPDVDEVPIHLRPYDESKYRVPSTKLKYSSGYALIEVEPFPRAKIMKICYHILQKVKACPEKSVFRVFLEEKTKFYMKLVDEIEDIQELEAELGADTIEIFINDFQREIELIDDMLLEKPWEQKASDKFPDEYEIFSKRVSEVIEGQYNRGERIQQKFVE